MITAVSAEALALDRAGRRLFEDLSFHLRPGEAIALTGPNGAGKTSLLRAIAGLLRPAAGQIRFASAQGPLEADEARASALHWLGSADGLKGSRTAAAELRFWSEWTGGPPVRLSGRGGPERSGREGAGLDAVLDAFGLSSQAHTEVRRLSTGQRRRLALARLLASFRPLWLLDEPLAPLDARWRTRVGEMMHAHLDEGGLIIAAVHDTLPIGARELRLESA